MFALWPSLGFCRFPILNRASVNMSTPKKWVDWHMFSLTMGCGDWFCWEIYRKPKGFPDWNGHWSNQSNHFRKSWPRHFHGATSPSCQRVRPHSSSTIHQIVPQIWQLFSGPNNIDGLVWLSHLIWNHTQPSKTIRKTTVGPNIQHPEKGTVSSMPSPAWHEDHSDDHGWWIGESWPGLD